MTRKSVKPTTRTRAKDATKPATVSAPVPPPVITYGRLRDGTLTVKCDGKDAGELRPSGSAKGSYYASVFSAKGYMLSREELRMPIPLDILKRKIGVFLLDSRTVEPDF